MQTLPADVVGETYGSTDGWDLLTDLADIGNRMPGQEGERRGAELIRERFESYGLDEVRVEEFPIPGWWRGDSALELPDRDQRFDGSHEVVALPGTPAGDVSGELVDVGYGLPEDFEDLDLTGKVAMASSLTPDDYGRWVHRGEKYGYAVESGAEGFVFYNHVPGSLPPTGDVGRIDREAEIPAVGVSKELGARLVRYCEAGGVAAELSVDCRNEPAVSRNISAAVGPTGPEAGDGEVLFTAHVDGHDVGDAANDNGVGCAMVVEVARALKAVEDDLESRVRFVVFGAEETGLYGSYYWSHVHDLDSIKCVVNVDGAGYSRNLEVHTHGFEAIGEAFREVSEEFGVDVGIYEQYRPHSDHWPFVQRGCPAAQAVAERGESGRGWGHTHGDTLDKLDVRDVRDLSILCAAGVKKLAEADRDVGRKTSEEVREATEEQGFDVGMKAVDNWPWGDERPWPWAEQLMADD